MAFFYLQGATSLQRMRVDGTNIATLTLPTGCVLSSSRRPRFAIMGKYVMMVNSPSWNLLIDPSDDDAVYSMSPAPPALAPTLAAGTSTGLTGAYKVRVTFGVKNTKGVLLSESPLSPEPAAFTLANQSLSVTAIPTAQEPGINVRRLYRTLSGGSTYFHWADLDGNTATSVDRGISDATIASSPVPLNLGNPPGTFGIGSRLELDAIVASE